jgi:23S rRNA-/tRNA-specific pseudouridylate synthase
MLHAWKIDFFHPAEKQRMKVTAKLKKDMESFINTLKR